MSLDAAETGFKGANALISGHPRRVEPGEPPGIYNKTFANSTYLANLALFPRLSPGSTPGMAADKCIKMALESWEILPNFFHFAILSQSDTCLAAFCYIVTICTSQSTLGVLSFGMIRVRIMVHQRYQ